VKVLLLGATGMVGQGVLRECLLDRSVEDVLTIGRSVTGQSHPKLRELQLKDLFDFPSLGDDIAGYDACFFCLGVSSAGMREEDYRHVTYDLTLLIARTLAEQNPRMTFIYVSGAGTDSTEQGRSMWARVKGTTENALLDLPLQAYMFRPGYIQPMHGIKSKTTLYRAIYAVVAPLYPVLKRLVPNVVTTNEQIGRAMIGVAASGAPKRVLASRDINAVGTAPAA
jgi:uncharacterized protein YbjT (DUF2867 family)